MKTKRTKRMSMAPAKRRGLLQLSTVGIGLVCSGGALAQQAAAEGPLETIVVTAQKRSERIQDVPVAVMAITGDSLEKMGSSRWEDLPLPAVRVGPGGLTDSMYIRGIGSGTNPTFEQSAPAFVDGMWYSSSRAARIGFLDIERIEILKGPQPTYFGKNAISGAMSVVTRKPRMKREGYVDVMYEAENEEKVISAAVTTPVSETLSMRFAGKLRALDKGWDQNLATGTMDPRYKDHAARVGVFWAPTDNFTLDMKFETGQTQENGRSTELMACTPAALANPGIINPATKDCQVNYQRALAFNPANFGAIKNLINLDRPAEQTKNKVDSVQLAATWNFNGYNLAANLNSYTNKYDAGNKQDHAYTDRALSANVETSGNDSLELRLDSPRKQSFFWTAGLFADNGKNDNYSYTIQMLPAANGGPTGAALGAAGQQVSAVITTMNMTSSSFSAFGELGFALTDQLTTKFAVRDTQQKKGLSGVNQQYFLSGGTGTKVSPSGLGGLLPAVAPTTATLSANPALTYSANNASMENKSTDPAITVEWRPVDRQMVYASARRGFKAGGLDFLNFPNGSMEFKPETVNYGELGTKLDFMNGALRFNAALFNGDYKNLQTAIVDPQTGITTTRNAGGARSQGAEFEVAWAVNQQWRVGGSLNYLNSKYTDFRGTSCWSNPVQTAAQGCLPVGTTGATAQDLTGKDTQFAPRWSGSAELRYKQPGQYFGIPSVFSVQLNVFSTSSFQIFANNDPAARHPSYSLVDLRFGLTESKNKWDLGFLIRNLFDETTMGWIANAPVTGVYNGAHFAVVNRPRQFALQGRYNF